MNRAATDSWNKVFIIFLILLSCGLFYLLQPILFPFAAGALLAYLCNPLVNKLMNLRMSRLLAVIIVFLALFIGIIILVLLLIPLIQKQIMLFVELIPAVFNWVQNTFLPKLMAHFPNQQPIDTGSLKNLLSQTWMKAGSMLGWIFLTMLNSGKAFIEGILNLLLIPVVTFYLLRD